MFVVIFILHRLRFIPAVFSVLQNTLHNIVENYANNDKNNIGNASHSRSKDRWSTTNLDGPQPNKNSITRILKPEHIDDQLINITNTTINDISVNRSGLSKSWIQLKSLWLIKLISVLYKMWIAEIKRMYVSEKDCYLNTKLVYYYETLILILK